MRLICLFVFVFFVGCGEFCIEVEGGYGDYAGEIEYCYDFEKSKSSGGAVFDTGETLLYTFDSDEISKIYDRIRGVVGLDAGAVRREPTEEEKCLEIRKILKEEGKR